MREASAPCYACLSASACSVVTIHFTRGRDLLWMALAPSAARAARAVSCEGAAAACGCLAVAAPWAAGNAVSFGNRGLVTAECMGCSFSTVGWTGLRVGMSNARDLPTDGLPELSLEAGPADRLAAGSMEI